MPSRTPFWALSRCEKTIENFQTFTQGICWSRVESVKHHKVCACKIWDSFRKSTALRHSETATCRISNLHGVLVCFFSEHRLDHFDHVEYVAIQDSHHGIEWIRQHHADQTSSAKWSGNRKDPGKAVTFHEFPGWYCCLILYSNVSQSLIWCLL